MTSIEVDLTEEEAKAFKSFIGKTTLGQIADEATASALRKVYLKLEKALNDKG